MGNCLAYPPKVEYDRQQKLASKMKPSYIQMDYLTEPPYNSRGAEDEQTHEKQLYDASGFDLEMPTLPPSHNDAKIEVETTKLSSNQSSTESSFHRQYRHMYIKRYRSEEEKLQDMLREKERLIQTAIRQGQELRAKCNRYEDELKSLKELSEVEITDTEWKKKYKELDKRYRDMKEALDVLAARNKNGRDMLRQKNDEIQILTEELQKEKLETQRLLSNSLTSLQTIGVKDKKGIMTIALLEQDKMVLEERIDNLAMRNKRGRDYLAKLEAEKREQEAEIAMLNRQLLKEREDKENLLVKVETMSSTHKQASSVANSEEPEYAKVNKTNVGAQGYRKHEAHVRSTGSSVYSGYSEVTDTKSLGFEIDDVHNKEREGLSNSNVYEDVNTKTADYLDGRQTNAGEPFIRTYVLDESAIEIPASGLKSSTPRVMNESIEAEYHHNWDDVPASGTVSVDNPVTRF